MPYFKTRLAALSKDLFLGHGWDLPKGHRENGWKSPDSFTLAEWQQARRIDLDPRELKVLFRDAWAQSDNLASFRHALTVRGYFLARGDRRGFVAVDVHGEVFSVARMLGIKTRDLAEKLGKPDGLPSVMEAKARLDRRMGENLRAVVQEARRQDQLELLPLRTDHRIRVVRQRRLRDAVAARKISSVISVRQSVAPSPARSLVARSVTPLRRALPRAERAPKTPGRSQERPLRCGEPTTFIRAQRPGESHDAYMAYRRACFRVIEAQLEERRATQRRIEELLAAQRARRMGLIARIAQLVQEVPRRKAPLLGRHP